MLLTTLNLMCVQTLGCALGVCYTLFCTVYASSDVLLICTRYRLCILLIAVTLDIKEHAFKKKSYTYIATGQKWELKTYGV